MFQSPFSSDYSYEKWLADIKLRWLANAKLRWLANEQIKNVPCSINNKAFSNMFFIKHIISSYLLGNFL